MLEKSIECPLDEILGFRSRYEFDDFTKWLDEQIKKNIVEEIAPLEHIFGDSIEERWFIHKESCAKWRLILPNGPSFTGSFRSFNNKNTCPWNEVFGEYGFKNYSDFENYSSWLDEQIKLGQAKEVPVNSPTFSIDGKPSGEKWYVHVKSEMLWRLVWSGKEPYFEKITETL